MHVHECVYGAFFRKGIHFVPLNFIFCVFFCSRARFVISVRRIVASPVCSVHTITVIVTIATIEINVYAFFLCSTVELSFGAIRCYAQSHTDRKREIGESVNRITVYCELICLLHHTHLFSTCRSVVSRTLPPSLSLSLDAIFLNLFIYFLRARSFHFFLI